MLACININELDLKDVNIHPFRFRIVNRLFDIDPSVFFYIVAIEQSVSGFMFRGLMYSSWPFLAWVWYSDQTLALTLLYKLEINLHLRKQNDKEAKLKYQKLVSSSSSVPWREVQNAVHPFTLQTRNLTCLKYNTRRNEKNVCLLV